MRGGKILVRHRYGPAPFLPAKDPFPSFMIEPDSLPLTRRRYLALRLMKDEGAARIGIGA